MKTQRHFLVLFLVSVFLVFGTSCAVIRPQHPPRPSKTVIIHSNPNGKIPPGQIKKMTGAKSAKQYAPGQQKKHKKNK
jgi:hypothetical protein